MNEEIRPIRFFCKHCGKELWQQTNYSYFIKVYLEQFADYVECADCILKHAKDNGNNGGQDAIEKSGE